MGPQTDPDLSSAITLSDLWIRTKDRRLIQFQPNPVQLRYLSELCPDWQAESFRLRGGKEILLKARQEGLSTGILALLFQDTINTPNTTTVVLAHDQESTNKLFRMVQLFYDRLPAHKKPETKYASKREFFWPTLNSTFYVGTAGAKSFGRGDTINNVHASEVAHWPDAKTLLTGLLEAVPEDGNVFIETTANGLGNWYEKEYNLARNGESVFTPRFFAWFEHPDYQSDVPAGFERTAKEEKLASAYDLTDRQLTWYRGKVKVLKEKCPQEYPSNPQEAFLTTGNPYFDRDRLQEMLQALQSDPDLAPITVPDTAPARLLAEARKPEPTFKIWAEPEPARRYVLSADTAEGITDSGDHDYDCADVIDAETRVQVAQLHGRWDTREFGLLLADLGNWYNVALLAPERNNHGHAVINALIYEAKYPEARSGVGNGLYYHEDYDEYKKSSSRKPGWPTTTKTKTFALDALASSLLNAGIRPRSLLTVEQLLRFVKLGGGKAAGEGGSHDDAVISLSIASALLLEYTSQVFTAATGGRPNPARNYTPR